MKKILFSSLTIFAINLVFLTNAYSQELNYGGNNELNYGGNNELNYGGNNELNYGGNNELNNRGNNELNYGGNNELNNRGNNELKYNNNQGTTFSLDQLKQQSNDQKVTYSNNGLTFVNNEAVAQKQNTHGNSTKEILDRQNKSLLGDLSKLGEGINVVPVKMMPCLVPGQENCNASGENISVADAFKMSISNNINNFKQLSSNCKRQPELCITVASTVFWAVMTGGASTVIAKSVVKSAESKGVTLLIFRSAQQRQYVFALIFPK